MKVYFFGLIIFFVALLAAAGGEQEEHHHGLSLSCSYGEAGIMVIRQVT